MRDYYLPLVRRHRGGKGGEWKDTFMMFSKAPVGKILNESRQERFTL